MKLEQCSSLGTTDPWLAGVAVRMDNGKAQREGGPPGCTASKSIRTQNPVCAWKGALPTLLAYPRRT